MLRKNYLVDQFYGKETLFDHYHLPGEGNLRGFISRGEKGAEALFASTTELSLFKNLARPERSAINFELAAFIDGGVFWNREQVRSFDRVELSNNFTNRNLADAGLGIRMNTSFFESDVYMRLDFPFFIYDGNSTEVDLNNWIFSFQRSL